MVLRLGRRRGGGRRGGGWRCSNGSRRGDRFLLGFAAERLDNACKTATFYVPCNLRP